MDITCGVPQGSVLGPLLFLIYTNHMPNCLKYTHAILFADDSTLFKQHKNLQDMFFYPNSDLALLCEWYRANKLVMNADKTKYILFSRNIISDQLRLYNLIIDGVSLERKQYVKFLGIFVDEHLKWHQYVDYVKSKIARSLYAIRSIRNNTEDAKTLYYTLIYPYLTYGIEV